MKVPGVRQGRKGTIQRVHSWGGTHRYWSLVAPYGGLPKAIWTAASQGRLLVVQGRGKGESISQPPPISQWSIICKELHPSRCKRLWTLCLKFLSTERDLRGLTFESNRDPSQEGEWLTANCSQVVPFEGRGSVFRVGTCSSIWNSRTESGRVEWIWDYLCVWHKSQ